MGTGGYSSEMCVSFLVVWSCLGWGFACLGVWNCAVFAGWSCAGVMCGGFGGWVLCSQCCLPVVGFCLLLFSVLFSSPIRSGIALSRSLGFYNFTLSYSIYYFFSNWFSMKSMR